MIKLLAGTHAEVREFLIDYLERELPALKRLQFGFHLLLCKNCATYLSHYRSGVELAQRYLNEPPPDELVALTLNFIEQRRPAVEGTVERGSS